MIDIIKRGKGLSIEAETRMFQILDSLCSVYRIEPFNTGNVLPEGSYPFITDFLIDMLSEEFDITGEKGKSNNTENKETIRMTVSHFIGKYTNSFNNGYMKRYLLYKANTKIAA